MLLSKRAPLGSYDQLGDHSAERRIAIRAVGLLPEDAMIGTRAIVLLRLESRRPSSVRIVADENAYSDLN